jgi:hypothetical protein
MGFGAKVPEIFGNDDRFVLVESLSHLKVKGLRSFVPGVVMELYLQA